MAAPGGKGDEPPRQAMSPRAKPSARPPPGPGAAGPLAPAPPRAPRGPTVRAELGVLHGRRRRRVRRRRRRARARPGAAAAAQFRQPPVGGREFGSQVGHLLAGRLDRPIDAERELLIVFHHAQDFGLGAREVTKSCMTRGGGRARPGALGSTCWAPPRPGFPRAPAPGTGSAGSSGAGMTAAPPARAAAGARRRGAGGGRRRSGSGRRGRDRRDPGAESARRTPRAARHSRWSLPFGARSGGGLGRGPGLPLSLPRPPLRGHTPRGGQGG